MLIEFSVKNFLSFKDKVTLSMEKGNGDEKLENVFTKNDVDLLRTTAIYGANASGKTNILKAFTCAILMIRNSNFMNTTNKWFSIKPFLFDKKTSKEPSEFEFIFIVNDVKYRYFFSADANKIYDEVLDAYYTQKPTNIFTRTNTNDYEFNSDKAKLESIAAKNTENKLFLTTATTWNYDKTKDAFLWFSEKIDTYDSFDKISDQDLIEYSKNDGKLKEFALKLLKEADIFIKDIHVDYEEKEMDNAMMDMLIPPLARTNGTFKMSNVRIELEHEITDENKNKHIEKLVFVFIIILNISLLAPYINMDKLSIISQYHNLKIYTSKKELNEKDKVKISGAYYYLRGVEDKIIDNLLTKEDINNILSFNEKKYYDDEYYHAMVNDINISGYDKLNEVNIYEYDINNIIKYNDITIDISHIINNDTLNNFENYIKNNNEIIIDNKQKLVIKSISINYNKYTNEYKYLSIEGYLLKKD